MAAHQAPPSLGFSRQEHWSGLPFPSPMHESEKWKWSCSVVSDSWRPHGPQPTRLCPPWDFPGKSTGVGCHCLLCYLSYFMGKIKGIAFSWWNQDGDRKVPKWYPQVWEWAWLYLSLIQRISLSREKGGPSKYLCGPLMLEGMFIAMGWGH